MKGSQGLTLFLTVILVMLLSFSLVSGLTLHLVQNTAIMNAPFSIGSRSSDGSHEGDSTETHRSDYKMAEGIIHAEVTSKAGPRKGFSEAWAISYLGDSIEIVHSSTYKVTFSFEYKGLVGATVSGGYPGETGASVKVTLDISLVDRSDTNTILQRNVTIFEKDLTTDDETQPEEIMGSLNIEGTIELESNHIYDWNAGIATETAAISSPFLDGYTGGRVDTVADFFDPKKGYEVEITRVFVEDSYPDHTPPATEPLFSGTLGEHGWYTSNVLVELIANDGDSASSYGINYTNQRINDGSWKYYTTPFTINSEGITNVDFYSVDKANNTETPKMANVKIDKTSPTGTITINSNNQYTSSAEVTLLTSASDKGSGVSQMRFHNVNDNWGPWMAYTSTPFDWTLKSGDGAKRVYAQFKDMAGNLSPEYYDDIILDTTAPSGTITINQNAQYTTSASVTLQLSYLDNLGISQVRYSNDGIWDTEKWETPATTKPWILLPGDGDKTVHARFMDDAGNLSPDISDTIVLDTTPPSGSIEINGNADHTDSTQVTLKVTAYDASGTPQMRLSDDGKNWGSWEPLGEKQWTLSPEVGEKTVYVQFRDAAGLISSSFKDTINLVAPEPSPSPSPSPQPTPTPSPTGVPTHTPAIVPTAKPAPTPTPSPSATTSPSTLPTQEPSDSAVLSPDMLVIAVGKGIAEAVIGIIVILCIVALLLKIEEN
jgi:hypothetical protein